MLFGFALSGLQEFLYDLSPQSPSLKERQVDGGRDRDAARRLRIRSLTLTLVPGLVAYELQQRDPGSSIIYLGGGKLYMEADAGAIDSLVRERLPVLFQWLSSRSAGKLGAHWTRLDEAESRAALHTLIANLAEQRWQAGRYGSQWHDLSSSICARTNEEGLGSREWESENGNEFGGNSDWVGFEVGNGDWAVGDWRVGPVSKRGDVHIWLDGPDAPDRRERPVVAIPTYTPKLTKDGDPGPGRHEDLRHGNIAPLFWLAQTDAADQPREQGAPYLALLKMDGDGMGDLMRRALEKGLDEFTRTSEKLSNFFGRELTDMLTNQFERIYLVYSGGDDLVLCGWYDDVTRAAMSIRERYQRLQVGTVSAGITFFTRQSPILKAIEEADRAIEVAKGRHLPDHGDHVCVGGLRLSWDQFAKVIADADGLAKAVDDRALLRGELQLIRQLGEPWLPSAPEAQRGLALRAIPLMHYFRSRRGNRDEGKWPSEVAALFDSLKTSTGDWPVATLVAMLAAWKTKVNGYQEEA